MEDQILNALPYAIPLVLGLTIITVIVVFASRGLRALSNYNRSMEERRK